MRYDVALLFSGGYDSTLLLMLALEMDMKPLCILIDYGQKHVKELEFAMNQCIKNKVDYKQVAVGLPTPSNLTSEAKTYPGVSQYHVPARNLIFIALAVSIAEGLDIPLVWYGANYEDREHLFPDCYQEWIYRLNKLLEINGSAEIKVEAPLAGMMKNTIKSLAYKYGINEKSVFGGYTEQE